MIEIQAPPLVEIDNNYPLEGYYRDINGNQYCVSRLIEASKHLPVFEVPLACIDISDEIWRDSSMKELAFHCKAVMDANLDYPIILDWYGAIADGRHRVIKALIEGRPTIRAVRLQYKLSPCKHGDGEKKCDS